MDDSKVQDRLWQIFKIKSAWFRVSFASSGFHGHQSHPEGCGSGQRWDVPNRSSRLVMPICWVIRTLRCGLRSLLAGKKYQKACQYIVKSCQINECFEDGNTRVRFRSFQLHLECWSKYPKSFFDGWTQQLESLRQATPCSGGLLGKHFKNCWTLSQTALWFRRGWVFVQLPTGGVWFTEGHVPGPKHQKQPQLRQEQLVPGRLNKTLQVDSASGFTNMSMAYCNCWGKLQLL